MTYSPPQTNSAARWALILGIIGLCLSLFVIGAPIGIVAVIFAIKGLSRPNGKGAAVTGLVAGIVSLPVAFLALAIWAAVFVPRFTGRADQARRMATIAEIHNLSSALNSFEIDNGRFPSSAEGLEALVEKPANADHWTQKYITAVPLDKWGRPFIYQGPDQVGDDEEFNIISTGRSGDLGSPDNIDRHTRN
jgi:general secretion pathway protein G